LTLTECWVSQPTKSCSA